MSVQRNLDRRVLGVPPSVETVSPVTTVTRNSDGTVATVAWGTTPLTHTLTALTYDGQGRISGFTQDGQAYKVARDNSGQIASIA